MEQATLRERIRAVLIFWSLAAATYFVIPRLVFFHPVLTPFYPVDQAIPFLSWTIVIYFSLYAQVSLMFLLSGSRKVLHRLLVAYVIAVGLSGCFYLLFPTTHNYPPPVRQCAHCFDSAVLWLRGVDVAANQLPSGHTLFSLLGPFLLLASRRYWSGTIFLVWGLSISASTLTVKQHNIADVVVGAILAALLGYFFRNRLPAPSNA